MASDEHIRLFCALRLPEEAVERLEAWQHEYLSQAAGYGCRIVPAANLHLTLAFLGRRPVAELPVVAGALRAAVQGVVGRPLALAAVRYRETRSVGMIVLRDETGIATALADDAANRLEGLGVYRRERRPWLPHVTVLRFRERPRLDPPLPVLGAVSPSDAAVYSSLLRSDGAQYEVLETIALSN